ncbi:FAD-dependent oxidoreductase [Clostridium tagluense]|uniref:NAD(P)/FAD-dependent oxidoreductase n=1 Tax=Clostridium tagluense TaxID=360422 RepID=UPI001C0C08B0|nr:NAD(P)/FAD-dependent oxidoreductase [Clostridium tagluense]MBU3128919.1 FAD-dependent oxidoreductase [Clostridium tagluense]MCB2310307.1 FAD-dependent oxidoreductase [Clostridium tagluense]MCB2315051.1 FAD-dependent oxidoreductase [Clostridium tagluense]MCB2320007.1 FAD-dependent oxidoreductase [Clostridium tagluense]MCB2324794.1 FAD-dependent oxidoreductase [Clostridium tagluense]
MYDVVIIGAGVVGSAIARNLSRYNLKVCILEKEDDVSTGASKANSGIVHGGYAAKYGTLKGQLCGKGNKMYRKLQEELNFGYRKTGALVIGFNEEDEKKIKELYENGLKMGCDDLEIIRGDKLKEIEPNLNSDVTVALYAKSVGVTSPYEFTIALVENAITNGVELKLLSEVLSIENLEEKFIVHTNKEDIEARYVINAAGQYSDKIANMLGMDDFEIMPKKGQYILMGKDQGHLVNTVIFQVPTDKGKGILVTTTYHGNFMIGPNSEEISDKDDVATTTETLKDVIDTARRSIPDFDVRKTLTTFSGIRASSNTGDFIIEESHVKKFINVAGIDSPGLTSSPAIAEMVADILVKSGLVLQEKDNFISYRKGIIVKKDNNFHGKIDDEDPAKNIICRCEVVTEAEIVDAIHRNIPINSTDAIKRRTRAGMGTCQANFCRSRVKAIIARELNIDVDKVTVRGNSSSKTPVRAEINLIRKLK